MSYPQEIYVTVDAIVFHPSKKEKQEILLIQRKNEPFKGQWALPGGFVDEDEDLLPAAKRELQEETGIKGVDFEQMAAVGTPGRDPRGRTVTIVYTCSANKNEQSAKGADDASAAKWFPLDDLPELAFDHQLIIQQAV